MSTAQHPTAPSAHEHAPAALSEIDRRRLGRRARLLAATSVVYNAVEGVIAVVAGLVAGSIALLGFGLDSVIEVSSGLVIVWQFRHVLPSSRERQAQRVIAGSFAALALYIGVESVRALLTRAEPEVAPVGIALAVASLLVMPWLSRAQRRTGRELHSAAVVADSTQTALCAWISAAVLVALVLNAALGWWWADALAGLVIAGIAAREARQTWRGDGCCTAPQRSAQPCSRS